MWVYWSVILLQGILHRPHGIAMLATEQRSSLADTKAGKSKSGSRICGGQSLEGGCVSRKDHLSLAQVRGTCYLLSWATTLNPTKTQLKKTLQKEKTTGKWEKTKTANPKNYPRIYDGAGIQRAKCKLFLCKEDFVLATAGAVCEDMWMLVWGEQETLEQAWKNNSRFLPVILSPLIFLTATPDDQESAFSKMEYALE